MSAADWLSQTRKKSPLFFTCRDTVFLSGGNLQGTAVYIIKIILECLFSKAKISLFKISLFKSTALWLWLLAGRAQKESTIVSKRKKDRMTLLRLAYHICR